MIVVAIAGFVAQVSLFQICPNRLKYIICAYPMCALVINILGSLGIKFLFGETHGIGIANLLASALLWGYILIYGWAEGVSKGKVFKVVPWAFSEKELKRIEASRKRARKSVK